MRTLLLLLIPLLFSFKHIDTLVVGDRVVPESSAVLQLESTSGAFLPPRMTTAQRNAISSPANGMLIYNTDFQSLQAYSSGVWGSVGGGGGAGLEPWVTGTLYDTDDVIFASDDKIYAANSSHTAGTFNTDLSNGLWRELSDDIDRLSSATDFAIATWAGSSGDALQVSGVTINASDDMTGVNSADIGNLALNLNTLSSTDTNGNIILDPNGTGNVQLPDLTVSQPAYVDALGNLVSQDIDLTADVTGVLPIANGGTGSATQNFVDLTTNQSIAGQKTFTDDTTIDASGSGDALAITHSGSGDGLSVNHSGSGVAATITGTVNVTGDLSVDNLTLDGNTVSSTDTNGNIILDPNGTGNVNLPDLTISQPAYVDASGNLVSQDLSLTADVTGILPEANGGTGLDASAVTDGQLLIGNTSDNTFDLATITGTTDQVSITNGNGSITLSTPQDIATTSSPTFAGVTSTGDILMSGTGQIDLPVGTTAQRSGSPNSGMLRFNSETSSFEGYNGSAWGSIGGGGGGLDVFYDEDHESATDSSDYTTGLNATFDNGGTLGGALADETTNPIAGATSIKYTTSATATNSTNDWIASASITLDDKQKGNFVGFNFFYTWDGSDDLLCVIVWDDTNNAVLNDSTDCLETASNPTRYSLGVFIPTSTNAIKLGFHHTGASESSKVLVFDDLELSSNPFVYKNLNIRDSARLHTANGFGTTNTKIRRYSNIAFADESGSYSFSSITSSATSRNGLFTITDSSADGTEITFNQKAYVTIGVSISGPAGFWGGLTINSSNLTTNLTSLSADEILALDYDSINTGGGSASWSGWVAAGDVIRPHTNGGGNGTAFLNSMSITATAPAEHVVTPAKAVSETYFAYQQNNFWDASGTISTFNSSLLSPSIADSDLVEIVNESGQTRIKAKKDITIRGYVGGYYGTLGNRVVVVNTAGNPIGEYVAAFGGDRGAAEFGTRLLPGEYVTATVVGENANRQGYINFTVRPTEAQFLAAVPVPLVAYVKDVRSPSTLSGAFTSGSYVTRNLNTVEGSTSIVSLSSNQMTLTTGIYDIEFEAPAYFVQQHRAKLRNITDGTDAILGQTNFANNTGNGSGNSSIGKGRITVSGTKVFELQHRCGLTKTVNGLGVAAGFGDNEVYAQVKITKLK